MGEFGIFEILTLIGGLALFLYGMDVMGDGLKKLAGGRMEMILAKLTSNPFKGFLLGFGVTAIIQSSSATTVMLVGFVNSGIMKLGQTISIIMGANVGTTVTAWLLSTSAIDGGGIWWLDLLKPSSFTPVLAVIGVIITMFSKSDKKKNIATILLGFAVPEWQWVVLIPASRIVPDRICGPGLFAPPWDRAELRRRLRRAGEEKQPGRHST